MGAYLSLNAKRALYRLFLYVGRFLDAVAMNSVATAIGILLGLALGLALIEVLIPTAMALAKLMVIVLKFIVALI